MTAKDSNNATSLLHDVPATLAGIWYNELGSKMDILPTSPVAGQFSGKYHTGVGEAEGWYDLVGRYATATDGNEWALIGW